MKKILLLFLFLGGFLFSSGSSVSNDPEKFVQFYISSLESREKAMELNEYLKSKDGVKMSRVDITSKTVYVIFDSNKLYNESDFSEWMNEKGYSFSCFNSGIKGVDAFKMLKPEECNTEK